MGLLTVLFITWFPWRSAFAQQGDQVPVEASPSNPVPISDLSKLPPIEVKDAPADPSSKSQTPANKVGKNTSVGDLTDIQVDPSKLKDPIKPDTETSAPPINGGENKPLGLPTGADKTGVSSQAISVPQGSGKIQGMGESFSAQLSTGIATFSVPFALPPARGAAQPALSLGYSSSGGHGLAGAGWDVGWPYIARQTDRGLPKFDDQATWHPEQDRFVFNGGQELVPICSIGADLACPGALKLDPLPGALKLDPLPALGTEDDRLQVSNASLRSNENEEMPSWAAGWQYFRARVEGGFLRFFLSPDYRTWRVQDKGGTVMELGVSPSEPSYTDALETNPNKPEQIFRWNLVQQHDQEGAENVRPNRVIYRYLQNGGMAYLSDIFTTPPAAQAVSAPLSSFAHHVRIVYEDRTDPTTSYRRGWATTSALRLKRVDVASKPFRQPTAGIDVVGAARVMVRRYHLAYENPWHFSLLQSVQVEGRCHETSQPVSVVENSQQELPEQTSCPRLPAMAFGYSHVEPFKIDGTPGKSTLFTNGRSYEGFDEKVLSLQESPKYSLDEEMTDLFDVNSDGLPDILVTAPGLFEGKHGLFLQGINGTPGKFSPALKMPVLGVLGADAGILTLKNSNVAPLDLDGDGRINLLHMPKTKSYALYEPVGQGLSWSWKGRTIDTAASQSASIDWTQDALDLRVLDVNGDGLVDVVRTTGTQTQTFFSLGRYPKGDGQFGKALWTGPKQANLSNEPVAFCVPWSGTPVRFSDPDIKLADMNGDGLADIVRIRKGDIRYWPGRGNGFFGTGPLDDCPAGTFGQERSVAMGDSPQYSDPDGAALRLDDVNGDGLDDLVQIRFNAVDIWLNVDGVGWTVDRHIIANAPVSPSYQNRVRLVDVNGSGTRDILWGDGYNYRYIDLLGGSRPWLLTRVENGLGKTSELQYTNSTQLMLAAQKAGGSQVWTSWTPSPMHVVIRSIERDNLAVAGRPAGEYVTEYSYRDPVYDGQQREFRGFRHATARRIGDANSPTSLSSSTFLLGECVDDTPGNGVDECAVSERWRDQRREALKGLPVMAETFDEKGIFLSGTHHTYRLRQLYEGLDGRAVVHAFEERTDSFLYDTAKFIPAKSDAPGLPLPEVEVQLVGASSTQSGSAKVRAQSGWVQTRSQSYVDAFGNSFLSRAEGCVAGCTPADETIWGVTLPARAPGDPTGWLWRTVEGWVPHGEEKRHRGATDYDSKGRPTQSKIFVDGMLPLERFHEGQGAAGSAGTSGAAVAPDPAQASTPTGQTPRVVGTTTYDPEFGLPTESQAFPAPGALPRRRTIAYDADYADLPLSETIFAGMNGEQHLTASVLSYDRGLGAVLEVRDLHDEPTQAHYDGFGRIVRLFRPQDSPPGSEKVCAVGGLPSVAIEYLLTTDPKGKPYSLLHTRTQRGPTPDSVDLDDPDKYVQQSWAYVDGFGRTLVTLAEADPGAGDGGKWVVNGLTEYDKKGAARRAYLAWFWGDEGTEATAYPLSQDPQTPYGRQRYDAFGRQVQTFGLDGTVTLQTAHHALCTDAWDAADLSPGPHQGTYASSCQDGHGRARKTTERVHTDNTIEERHTLPKYLPSGEVVSITRLRNNDAGSAVTRWMRHDSQGRMVLNVEPNTSKGFTPVPQLSGDVPATLKAWRYAYNDLGDLVGTSDARGCGSNYHYDAAGRLVAEDYSPCRNYHQAYTEPDLQTGDGTEVFTRYDEEDPEAAVVGQGFAPKAALYKGRVASVSDRGNKVLSAFDCRGRAPSVAKRMAKPGPTESFLAARYAPRWYVKHARFDGADRPVLETTGARVTELQGQEVGAEGDKHTSAVTTQYSKRGLVTQVGGSYGELVTSVIKDADGLTQKIEYGDLAKTSTVYQYDNRRRIHTVQTFRGPPDCWTAVAPNIPEHCKGYAPSEQYLSGQPSTFPLLLEDTEFAYDAVDNPTEIRDWRLPHEWPSGAKPVSRKMQYDDLYRLKRIDYQYSAGEDAWTSPFEAENTDANPDPRRAKPSPHVKFDKRVLSQRFAYDWLGNTTETQDDAHGFYDRSLGTIQNGAASDGPYQLRGASNQTGVGEARQGSLTAKYDEAGYLVAMAVNRITSGGACLPEGTACNQRFVYEWDEAGRLQRAQRWDVSVAGTVGDTLPAGEPAVELRYQYDGGDQRTLKTAVAHEVAGVAEAHTAYMFGSLELRRAGWTEGEEGFDFEQSTTTEVAYLGAHGAQLARLHYQQGVPSLESDGLHVFLELADHLGSSSLVLDRATGELAEKTTYQAYGATESDYRPGRWQNFREDHRFTGKEEDVEVGLQYFGFRYYAPNLNRWVSADPITVHMLQSDLNAFAYVHGSVLKFVDPVGLCPNAGTGGGCGGQAGDKAPNYGTEGQPTSPQPAPSEAQHSPGTGCGVYTNCAPGDEVGAGGAPNQNNPKIIVGGNAGSRGHYSIPRNHTTKTASAEEIHFYTVIFTGALSLANPVVASGRALAFAITIIDGWALSTESSATPEPLAIGSISTPHTNHYMGDPLKEAVWAERVKNNDFNAARNYSAVRLENGEIFVSKSGDSPTHSVWHAERVMLEYLEDKQINPKSVVSRFSEREGCDMKGHDCETRMKEKTSASTGSYLVPFNGKNPVTGKGYGEEATKALENLIENSRKAGTPKDWHPPQATRAKLPKIR